MNIHMKKVLFLGSLILNLLLIINMNFLSFACDVNIYINNSNNNQIISCNSDDGVLIENITGNIYCSQSPNLRNPYSFKKIEIINSNIGFINCELRNQASTPVEVTIENSTIALHGSRFWTNSIKNAFENEIVSDNNSKMYHFEPFIFDIFIGPSSLPVIVESVDVRRNFNIDGSTSNFSLENPLLNNLISIKTIIGQADSYFVYLPVNSTNQSSMDLRLESYQINFNISKPEIIEQFNYSGSASLSTITQIEIEDNQIPEFLRSEFQYNPTTQVQRLFLDFDKILSNLTITIYDLNQSNQIVNQFASNNRDSFEFGLNIFNTESTHFNIDFYYEDYFENSNIYTIRVIRPSVEDTQITSQNVLLYSFYPTTAGSVLNATLSVRPGAFLSIVEELLFQITPLSKEPLVLQSHPQIHYNNSNSYFIPNNSSLFQEHTGTIRTGFFNSEPLVRINNVSFISSNLNTNNNRFEYEIFTSQNYFEILNNTKITLQADEPRYFNRSFEIEVEYLTKIDNFAIEPSLCQIQYNLETPTQNVTNLTYDVVSNSFRGEIFFTQYLPLDKNVIVSCQNSFGFENITNTFSINHTHQPISDFIFSIIYEPINLGSGIFTTRIKELGINISSSSSENTDPTTDNIYYLMVSRAEFNALNWNITKNVTPWINIGKNEQVVISHNDSNNNRAMRVDLENGSHFMINDSFIFRDERVGNSGISLFTIVKSCVPGGVCRIVSDSSEFYIFQDTTPPIVYEFNVREITNDENFEFRILVDDLESDMLQSRLILTNINNENQQSMHQILNYEANTTSLSSAPFTNIGSILEGIIYNISIHSINLNNLEGTYISPQTLLLDNQPPRDSEIEIVNSFNQNTTPQRFYLSDGLNVEFNVTAGVDDFFLYEFNAGISHYEIIVDEQSNNCNTRISQQYRVNNSISDEQSQVVELNLSQNMCNRVLLFMYDFAGNVETITPLDIIIDTTPPEFNTVLGGGLFIAPSDGNNTKRFNRWEIDNNTVLFEYVFDIFDDLSPIREIQINLYKREQSSSTFNKVEEFHFDEVITSFPFSLSNYSFKDGNFYKIGIIATNFANLSNIELNSSATYLFLSNRVDIEPAGLFRANSNSILYSDNFVNSGMFPITFSNNNRAPIQCLVSDTSSINYNSSLPNQCLVKENNSILQCPTPQSLIQSLNPNSPSIFVNCLVDNADASSEQYFNTQFNLIMLNETSNVDVELISNSLTSNYLDNETIQLDLDITQNGLLTFIFQQELENPVSSVESIVFEQKGIDLTLQDLQDKKTIVSDLNEFTIFFIFNESNLVSTPTIEFDNYYIDELIGYYQYVINFNSTIGQEELQNLFDSYISENQHIQNKLFTRVEINLTSNISSTLELNHTVMNSKLDYVTSLLSPFGLESLNFNNISPFFLGFTTDYILNLNNVRNNLSYDSTNFINLTFFDQINLFSKIYEFNVSYSPRPLELNSSQSLELNLNPSEFHIINISEFIIAPNDDINFEYNISTQFLNSQDPLVNIEIFNSTSSTNSLFEEEMIVLYLTQNFNYLNPSNITIRVEDTYGSILDIPLRINWSDEFSFNTSKLPFFEERLLNLANNSFNIDINQTPYPIHSLEFIFSNQTLNERLNLFQPINLVLNYSYIDTLQINYNSFLFINDVDSNLIVFSDEVLQELYKIYLEEEIIDHEVNLTFNFIQGFDFTITQNMTFEFDFNQNSIPDLSENIIIFEESIINNESGQQFIQTNFNPSNTQESYFNITTPHFNNSNILISWIDNNSNQWNFAFTQILVENKTFENESLNGSRISVINFPKFESNKSISIPPLENSSDLVYCLQDDDSNNISSQCSLENEFIISSCNTNISSSISCVEENGLWKILNLSFTTIESVCLESWDVGSWSRCSGGLQTRTVTATHNCGSNITRPESSRSCTTSGGGGGSSGGGGGGGSSGGGGGSNIVSPPTELEETPITTPINPTPIIPPQNNDNEVTIVEPEIPQNPDISTPPPEQPTQPIIPPIEEEDIINEESNNLIELNLSNPLIIGIIILFILILILTIVLILKNKNKKVSTKKISTTYYEKEPKIEKSSSQNNKNTNIVKEKNLSSLSIVELDSLKQQILNSLQEGNSISQICIQNKVKKEQNIRTILEISGFSNYITNLESEIKFNKTSLNTPAQIEQLLQKQWFFSYKPCENLDNYVRDLGFFITKYKITNVFSEKELEEIFIDSIYEDLK